jgi:hypothetical protein
MFVDVFTGFVTGQVTANCGRALVPKVIRGHHIAFDCFDIKVEYVIFLVDF